MDDVTTRLLAFYSHLKNNEIISGQSDFAKEIGVSSSSFTEISKGRTKAGMKIIQKTVTRFTDLNPVWLLTGEGEMILKSGYTPSPNDAMVFHESTEKYDTPSSLGLPKVVTVDKVGRDNVVLVPTRARAGYLLGYGDPEYISDLPSYHLPGIQNGTFRAFEVEGHSMVPTVKSGDIAIGEYLESFDLITDDRVYVLVTKHDGILIKRILNRISKYGFILAKSDSITNREMYPNLKIDPNDISELWYVKSYMSADLSSPSGIYDRINELEASVEYLKSRHTPDAQ